MAAKKHDDDTIEHEALVAARKAGDRVVVDVREPHEYAAGHVPGAVNLPLSSFDPAALPSDKPVVLVCQSGRRSSLALKMARDAGRADVTHYAPGTVGWAARGEDIER